MRLCIVGIVDVSKIKVALGTADYQGGSSDWLQLRAGSTPELALKTSPNLRLRTMSTLFFSLQTKLYMCTLYCR